MQLVTINNSRMAKLGFRELSNHEGDIIELLTLTELQTIKNHTPEMILITISGKEVMAQDIDEDTRMGYTACGFLYGYMMEESYPTI
jgi:hypothetical protein